MEKQLLSPVEVAEILQVKKNTVYEMIKRGDLKASKMGKQFRIARGDVYEYLGITKNVETPDDIVICGQDMLLDALCAMFNSGRNKDYRAYRSPMGSYNGLYEMYQHENYIATCHLWDGESNTYNLPYVERMLPGEQVAVFHLIKRWIGFYVKVGNPKNIHCFEDLLREDVLFVNREKGSGIRVYVDEMCKRLKVLPDRINGYRNEAASHLIAATMVQRGSGDVAIGNQKTASQLKDIEFIPIREESYDMVIRKMDLESKAYQDIVALIQSEQFAAEAAAIDGYNIEDIGKRLL